MKGGRGKTLDQLKNMQEAMNKKVRVSGGPKRGMDRSGSSKC